MSLDFIRPTRLATVLDTSATLHVIAFGDDRPPHDLLVALSERRGRTQRTCHVEDRYAAESALWRAETGDHVLLVGPAEALEDGLAAARDRGFLDAEIALIPTDSDERPAFCTHCATPVSTAGPGEKVTCTGCDAEFLGMPA